MAKRKSSISKASSYQEMGEFWDTHDLTDYWDQTKPVEFTVNLQSEATYYRLESSLSDRIQAIAKQRGVSAETLLNLWVQEKLQEAA
jgi:hypothetical protein